ncbi:unnamed protein product [Hydatigera taeniaeformis]|uniref:Uncharacterized protein n=1 Tax=Hydatigena taeniaeformis TaxID=6205 RepID=A0A3P7G3S1_HYDTA|nr:unnamed protein product [Hydatigera taeniaeformis]
MLLQNGRNNLILKNMQLQLLQQQLAQGAMLPGLSAALAATASTPSVASPGTPGTHAIAGAPQCPNPTSPVSSASIGPTLDQTLLICHSSLNGFCSVPLHLHFEKAFSLPLV